MNKYPPEILIVLLYAMIQLLDMSLIEKAQNFFLELSASLSRDDLNQCDFPVNRFFDDAVQFRVNLLAAVIDVVQVKFKFCHYFFFSLGRKSNGGRWFILIRFARDSLVCSTVIEPVSQLNR